MPTRIKVAFCVAGPRLPKNWESCRGKDCWTYNNFLLGDTSPPPPFQHPYLFSHCAPIVCAVKIRVPWSLGLFEVANHRHIQGPCQGYNKDGMHRFWIIIQSFYVTDMIVIPVLCYSPKGVGRAQRFMFHTIVWRLCWAKTSRVRHVPEWNKQMFSQPHQSVIT